MIEQQRSSDDGQRLPKHKQHVLTSAAAPIAAGVAWLVTAPRPAEIARYRAP